jgi:hypothetical protein
MQKLLTLIIMGIIIYTLLQKQMDEKIAQVSISTQNSSKIVEENKQNADQTKVNLVQNETVEIQGNFLEKTISKIVINALKTDEGKIFFENILQPLNKPFADNNFSIKIHNNLVEEIFQIKTFGIEKNGQCICGTIVDIQYQILDMQNNLLNSGEKNYSLGFRPIMPAIDNIVVGMYAGQTRSAIIPPKYSGNFSDIIAKSTDTKIPQFLKLNVNLKSIIPNNNIHLRDIKIFDDEISYKIPLFCGDFVSFDATITLMSNNKIIYDSLDNKNKIEMKIGDQSYPMIFAIGLHGKVPVGKRTIITKGKYLRALGSNLNKILPHKIIIENEYYIIEIQNLKFIK